MNRLYGTTIFAIITSILLMVSYPSKAEGLYGGVGLSYNNLNGPLWQGQVDSFLDQAAMSRGESASSTHNENVKGAIGGRMFIGYRDGALAYEVGYGKLGTFKSNISSPESVGIATLDVAVVDMSLLAHYKGFFGRVGVHHATSESNSHSWVGYAEETKNLSVASTGPLVGIGYQYGMVRAEYIRYFGVGLTDVTGKHSVDTFMLSLVKEF